MTDLAPALRNRLGTLAPLLLIVALLVAGVGGWMTYTAHADPGTRTETRTVSQWTTATGVQHSAVVREENEVFPVGERFSDRSVYYTQVMPVLDGTYRLRYTASESGTMTARTELTLVIRAVEGTEQGESETVYWRVTDPLANATATDVRAGETVRTSFDLNVSALDARVERLGESLGGTSGSVETFVRARTTLEGTVNGRDESRTLTTEIPLQLDDTTYSVGAAGDERTFPRTRPVTVRQSYGPLWSLGGPLLAFLGLAAVAGLAYAVRTGRFDLTETERARLEYERAYAEFDEWVTTARIPDEALEGATLTVDSLEGLVDIAIDTNNRVIETPDSGFVVLDDGLVYTFTPPGGVTGTEAETAVDGTSGHADGEDSSKESSGTDSTGAGDENEELTD